MKTKIFLLALAVATVEANAQKTTSKVVRAAQFSASAAQGDATDSLYRAAREAMSRGSYSRAAEIFQRLTERYPNSKYTEQAFYYEALALSRSGEEDDLEEALRVLRRHATRFPDKAKSGDARQLRVRICGELARRGDEACAAEVAVLANPRPAPSPTPAVRACPASDDENDERVAALNALLQMDADRAMPILERVIARRDPCSAGLREKAVFLISQKSTAQAADILLRVARSDPSSEVRQQAVFWLSQVRDERAVDMLNEILRSSRDVELQEKALFALSQHRSTRGNAILREFAQRDEAAVELRDKAIFWLGQKKSPENADFLRRLYGQLRNDELKEKILFSLSQQRGMGNDKWLLDIARNSRESDELRKKALFWAGQGGASMEQLVSLYAQMPEREMREQLIFVYSQRRDPAATTKLFEIAKSDRDPELRKKAIFWLGQSRDPRVQQFLVELIDR